MQAAYWGLCSQMDAAIGEIMKQVDLNETLFIYSSDHGDYQGRRGRMFKMPVIPMDDISKVPYFACGYGVPKGARVENPVGLVDIAPTFLTAAGLPVPEQLDGVALQRYFRNPKFGDDRTVYCFGEAGFDMVKVGKMKYFAHHTTDEEMLFDLENDPHELKNIADDPQWSKAKADLAARMKAVHNRPVSDLPYLRLEPEIKSQKGKA